MARDMGRQAAIAAASLFGHGAILTALALLRGAVLDLPPAQPVIEVQLVPAFTAPAAPPSGGGERPSVVTRAPFPRLARRPAEAARIAPLVLPAEPLPTPGPSEAQIRAALRAGSLGCANPDAIGLDAAARDRCAERLGDGAAEAAFIRAPLARDKQAAFDRAAARKAADRRYREANIAPGLSTSDAPGGIAGLGQTGHGAAIPF